MKDWKDILYDSMDDKTDNLFKKTKGCKNPIKTNKMEKSKQDQVLSNKVHAVVMCIIVIILITINI